MRVRFALYGIAALLATYTLAVSIRTSQRVPHIADMYNLVYANSRPKRSEDTQEFLVFMPTLTVIGLIATIVCVERGLARERKSEGDFSAGAAMLAFLGICGFSLAGLERVRDACELFRC